jgi:putative ABC transport system permease protein
MPEWKQEILKRLAALKLAPAREAAIVEELSQHLDDRYRELVAGGTAEDEARRVAIEELKDENLLARGLRRVEHEAPQEPIVLGSSGGHNFLSGLWQDIRYGLRQLWHSPGFAAVAVLSLGLGVGANSAIFSVMNTVMYRPLPYPHPKQLVAIWETKQGQPGFEPPPIAEVVDWRKQNDVFQGIALTSGTEPATEAGLGEPEPIHVQYVTPNFFGLLGVKPILGRIFFAREMQDRSLAVVISSSFWKSHFGSSPKVLGRSFEIDGVMSTVVGVMPPGFAPFGYGGGIDLWEPINPANPRYSARTDHWLMPVARLKPGVALEQAQNEMDVIAHRLALAYPATNKGVGKKLVPLHQALYGWAGRALYPLLGAVAFVLLIGCLNVASLLQSRAETRRKEFAVRASLGAGRARLAQQLFVESGILALLGGCLGIGLSFLGIRVFLSLAGGFPNSKSITVDGRVLLFALGVAILSVVLVGLAPAIQASSPDLNRALREGERRTSGGSRGRIRHFLVAAEVALAMVLLVGAGLMVNSMLRVQRVNPGFDPSNVLTMDILLPEGGRYLARQPGNDMEKTLPTVNIFHRELLEDVARLPGVASVGLVSGVPTHWAEGRTFTILGRPAPPPNKRPGTAYNEVSPGYFTTLRIPLKEGRYINEQDAESTPWVVDVNEAFVRRFFPKQDPMGQQILMRYGFAENMDEEHPREIVGVVGNIKQFGLGEPAPPFVYASYFQQAAVFPGGTAVTHLRSDVVIRTASSLGPQEAALAKAVKKVVAQIDPNQPVTGVMTMDRVLQASTGDQQFYAELLAIFAGLALGLALVGIYGVMSYFVTDRTHEIGIRVALGAQRSDVLRLVVGQGLRLTLIGVGVGVAAALGLTRFLAAALYGVRPTDPLTFIVVSLTLIGVALLACYIPARRAAKVDPMVALRYE